MDFSKFLSAKNTKYIIKNDINLGGKVVKIGEGCKIEFKGGSLCNGTLVGNNTALETTKRNVFHNCSIRGTWITKCAYSSMFDENLEAMLLLHNMSNLSPVIKLSANRRYDINVQGDELVIESIIAEGVEKPTLYFHTKNPNILGIKFIGEDVFIRNLIIIDDYQPSNDVKYGNNDITRGGTIGVVSSKGIVNSLKIEGCEFKGGTSSSFIASSQVRECLVENCLFSGYMADHAVYCSTKIEKYEVRKCLVKDVVHTTGLFKVRTSRNLILYSLNHITAHNLNGYMTVASLLESPNAKLLFEDINVTKDSDNKSVFYGFCITDETKTLEDLGRFNAEELSISNCRFAYGYNGAPIVYPGSGKRVCVNTTRFVDSQFVDSNFGGICSNNLVVNNCRLYNCCGEKGILIASKVSNITNSYISRKGFNSINYLFHINYSSSISKLFTLNNLDIDIILNNLCRIDQSESLNIEIKKCNISELNRNVIFQNKNSKVKYNLDKLMIKKRGSLSKVVGVF